MSADYTGELWQVDICVTPEGGVTFNDGGLGRKFWAAGVVPLFPSRESAIDYCKAMGHADTASRWYRAGEKRGPETTLSPGINPQAHPSALVSEPPTSSHIV
jgi:hypothetical protein